MDNIRITITEPEIKKYPLHQHPCWEIMYYLSGEGHLATQSGIIPFKPGSIILVPPKTVHGSVSSNGFVNIAVGGNFSHLFLFDNICVQTDDVNRNGERLARLIFENQQACPEYLSALCNAYAHFLLQNVNQKTKIASVIQNIIEQVNRNFSDSYFDISSQLAQGDYAEDYIRTKFKEATTLTPVDFLTKKRVEHGRRLIEIYGKSISVSEVADACGFDDPIYFSRRFKQFIGLSPAKYRKQVLIP